MNSISICLVLAACCAASTTANAAFRLGFGDSLIDDCDQLTGFGAPYGRPLAVAAAEPIIPVTAAPILRTAPIMAPAPIMATAAPIMATAAPIMATAAPIMGPRIATGLGAAAVSSQMMHKVDMSRTWAAAPAPILRTAGIMAPAPIMTATAAPLMETRYATAAAPILRPALAGLAPSRMLIGGASYDETNLASTVLHPSPIAVAAGPARMLAPAMPYSSLALPSTSASYQSLGSQWRTAIPYAAAAAPVLPYAPRYLGAGPIAAAPIAATIAPIAATAATLLDPCYK